MDKATAQGTPSPARARRARVWQVVGIALLAIVAAGAVALGRARWHVGLVDVRFLDHREKVSGGGAALNVTGYAVVRIESRRDLFRLARDENSYPQVQVTLCATGQPVGAWRDPLPVERDPAARRFVYALLVPARYRDIELARAGDLCLRLLAVGASMAPWAQSASVTVPLSPELREQMAAYDRRKGEVDVALDPLCAPRLCQPE